MYIVHIMNSRASTEDSYHSLLLLEEIAKEETVSQRDLSKRLEIALGLVNSYVKNMISKGYIRVTIFPRNRYHYLLTPNGIAEKTRLTYQHLSYFTNLYNTARIDFWELFHNLEKSGVKKVVFCGVDEVSEIAFLSLQETKLELIGIVDDYNVKKDFFHLSVRPISGLAHLDYDKIIVTSVKRRSALIENLKKMNINENQICLIRGNFQ